MKRPYERNRSPEPATNDVKKSIRSLLPPLLLLPPPPPPPLLLPSQALPPSLTKSGIMFQIPDRTTLRRSMAMDSVA